MGVNVMRNNDSSVMCEQGGKGGHGCRKGAKKEGSFSWNKRRDEEERDSKQGERAENTAEQQKTVVVGVMGLLKK